jgi:hypothetical protein
MSAKDVAARQRQCHVAPGEERRLIRTIRAERLDEVQVLAPTRDVIDLLEQAGFPVTGSGARQLWWSNAATESRARADLLSDWNGVGARWRPELEMSGVAVSSEPGADRYYATDGVAWLRWDAEHQQIHVSAEPLSPDQARACAEILVEQQRPIVMPVHQLQLQALLYGAGVLPQQISWGCVLHSHLSRSELRVLVRPFQVSADDVARFGQQSGDMNPLHFDDAFARAAGFEGRISHGMLFNGWLTKLLGTEYPGAGTIFLRHCAMYLAPVYPGRHYEAVISTPLVNVEKNTRRVVAQLLGEDGRHCVVSYNDVLQRNGAA